ncbi:hypothetical protein [Emticicia fluvialis]|uniref:hypothetical protein n=1 Tax=Emticicia fluvialis TaxID=2974474 RepID=UPI002165CF5B|nr:hypothetical protein [Emticicia fluvialis]
MKKVSVLVVFSVTALLIGCYNDISFDLIPYIEFRDLRKETTLDSFSGSKKDSVIISIHFEDGDGDLGLSEEEKKVAVDKQDFNYLLKIFRSKDGVFQEIPQPVPYSGFFPRLKLDDKKRPIEGTLNYSIVYFHNSVPAKDTVKYQITIKDRAGNVSNTVESKPIILREF